MEYELPGPPERQVPYEKGGRVPPTPNKLPLWFRVSCSPLEMKIIYHSLAASAKSN